MQNSHNKEELTYIKLSLLILSTRNVRTVPASKEEDKCLKAAIKAQGITQCLVVIKEGDQYGVIAGGRRLKQLNKLVDEGVIANDYLVPCLIKEANNISISAISLSENIKAKMHPADEFIAFSNMINEGKSIVSIAHEFGVTQKLVKERLKMAALAPSLIDYYRAGKIDLQDIMAFTVTDDHQQQIDCYNELKPHYLHPHRIKQFLLKQSLSIEEPIVKLVTVKAYKKAGGSMTTDLFESSCYINDKELLETLALELLEKKAKSLKKQWKWVELSLSPQTRIDYEATLTAEPVNVPESLTVAIKEKEDALNTLNKIDYEQWTDEQETLENRLESELESLDKKLNKYRRFTPQQKQVAGALVKINHNGKITVNLGLVKKEDMPEAFPETDKDISSSHSKPEPSTSIESQALKSDLANYKLQASQSHIMKDDKLAYDLMVFSIASSVLSTSYSDKPITINTNPIDYRSTNGIDETKAAQSIIQVKESLDLSWLSHPNNAEKFLAFQQLSSAKKKRMLTYCTALNYQLISDIDEVVSNSNHFSLANYWKPTEENYYKRITINGLLDIGKTEIGQDWEKIHHTLPKSQLVEKLSQHKKMSHWMPESVL